MGGEEPSFVAAKRPTAVVPQADAAERPGALGAHASRLEEATLGDVEAIRLLLRGGSVIDWHRLAFHNLDEVDRFLRVNEFDPAVEGTLERLEELRAEAVEYLQRNFSY